LIASSSLDALSHYQKHLTFLESFLPLNASPVSKTATTRKGFPGANLLLLLGDIRPFEKKFCGAGLRPFRTDKSKHVAKLTDRAPAIVLHWMTPAVIIP
jgi:hypothetical protein